MATLTTIDLSWSAASDNIGVDHYYVWQTYPVVQLKATLNASELSHTVTGLSANTAYKFKIKADDAAGNMSSYSNEITCRTLSTITTPLVSHADWDNVGNVSTDRLGWAGNGTNIYAYNETSSTYFNLILRYKGYTGNSGILSGYYDHPTGTDNWVLPFAKMLNANNLIGARMNNNLIEIVRRSGGTWSTIASTAAVNGYYEVTITDADITVVVDGTQAITHTHSISGSGSFGISTHKWQGGDGAEFIRGYNVTTI